MAPVSQELEPPKIPGRFTCHYLGETGCTIYERRPEMCRAFTCVGWVERILSTTTRAERRRDLKEGLIDRETWDAGVARLPDGAEA
jgi:Fe-S-cluster containining protein